MSPPGSCGGRSPWWRLRADDAGRPRPARARRSVPAAGDDRGRRSTSRRRARCGGCRSATDRWPPTCTGSARIQYYGGTKRRSIGTPGQPAPHRAGRRSEPVPLLYPLLDLTTTLDPHFNIAYRFGAIFLAEPYPGGPGRPDLAIALLEKGLRREPDKWEYMQDIGFVHYWWIARLPRGRGVVRQGQPTCRRAVVAARRWPRRRWRRAAIGSRRGRCGRRFAQSAEVDWLQRDDAQRRLVQLRRARRDRRAADAVVERFVREPGMPARDWQTARSRPGVLRGVPVDPTGTPYELSAGRHASTSSRRSPLCAAAGRAAADGRRSRAS